jgi:hypothetical protein
LHFGQNGSSLFRGLNQDVERAIVLGAQGREDRLRCTEIASFRSFGGLNQFIGHPTHGGYDHHQITFVGSVANDFGDSSDTGRIAYRGSAELHDSQWPHFYHRGLITHLAIESPSTRVPTP